jgi:UDP-3-O-[3-hydroxymyristoyl] glucosamine N-acyltransferase
MKLTAAEICEMVQGELVGDGEVVADHVASLTTAGSGAVTFAKEEFLKEAAATEASVILVPKNVEGCKASQIIVSHPYMAFGAVLKKAEEIQRVPPKGIHASAVIGEDVTLGDEVAVGPCAVIGDGCAIGARAIIYPNATIGANCTLGEDSVIHSNTSIREETAIGDRTTIHSNCTIGGDGFGYLQSFGGHQKIPQVGVVRIGNDVEIGCNCTVDRATMDVTRIGNGVKIDNHSHLAHNVEVGDNSLLVAYARIGGSTKIGKNVIILEDIGITNGVEIGAGSMLGAGSKVTRSWPAGSQLLGAPAQHFADEKKLIVLKKKLPRIYDKLRALEAKVKELEGKMGAD